MNVSRTLFSVPPSIAAARSVGAVGGSVASGASASLALAVTLSTFDHALACPSRYALALTQCLVAGSGSVMVSTTPVPRAVEPLNLDPRQSVPLLWMVLHPAS